MVLVWNFFRNRAIKKRAIKRTQSRFLLEKNWAKAHNPAEYKRLVKEEKKAIKEAIKFAIEDDIGTRRLKRKWKREEQEAKKLASPREKQRISKKISVLSAELRKLEAKHTRNYKNSKIEELEREERKLDFEAKNLAMNAKTRFDNADKASTRKERRMYRQEGKEWQKRATRAKKEHAKALRQFERVGNRLDKTNDPILNKIYSLRSQITELERTLQGEYWKDHMRKVPSRKPTGEVEREVFAIYRNIDEIEAKMGRFNHVRHKINKRKREYEFKTRYIEGESERARDRRLANARKWHDKNLEPLFETLHKDEETRYGKPVNALRDTLHTLRDRLKRLEPLLEEETAAIEEKRLREQTERKQAQMMRDAQKKIRQILQDEEF